MSAVIEDSQIQSRYSRGLAVAMSHRSLTPAQLAARVGATERSVQRWLKGQALPHLATSMRVFVTLGRPPELNLASLVPA